MVAITLNSSDLGNVETLEFIKNGNIELSPRPRNDSTNTYLFDFNGATKSVILSGTYTDSSAANIKTNFIDVVEAILDGNQSSVVTFASDVTGSISVLVQEFTFTWDINVSEYVVRYTIALIEGLRGGQ
jgi:PKD repeat protein